MLFIITSVFSSKISSNTPAETTVTAKTYSEIASTFETVTVDELKAVQEKDEIFFLYVGRETCPYCAIFVPKLDKATTEQNSIYYLDTENKTNELVEYLDSYKIESVPYLAKVNGREIVDELYISNELTVSTIKEFLNK